MRHWALQLFFCLLLFSAGTPAVQQVIDGNAPQTRLDACVSVLEDPSGKLSIADVSAPAMAGRFQPVQTTGELHLGISHSAWWLRCTLDLTPMAQAGKLEIGDPHLDRVAVYFTRNGKLLDSSLSGDLVPVSARPTNDHRLIFPLPPAEGEITLFVRIQSAGPVTVPLRWLSSPELERVIRMDMVILAAYWGILLALGVYNLFLFFAVRAWSFLHYVLSTLAYGFGLIIVLGYGASQLWPETPQYNNAAPIIAMSLAGIFGTLFAGSFFSTKRRFPKLHRWLIGVALVQTVSICISPFSPETSGALFTLMGNTLFVLLLIILWRSVRDRWPGTLPYAVALALQVLVSVSQALQTTGMVPTTLWTNYSVQFGSAGVAILYALGIAVRLNAIKRAKELAQAQALASKQALVDSLRENERELERRVEERTKELAEVNAALLERERQLEDLAHHDMLTGAASRVLYEDRLLQAMARSVRTQRLMALLLIDLDGFKAVNDTYGHDAGDAVLVELARRFRGSIRSIDTFGRQGGDEFVVIIEDLTVPEDASRVASKILREAAHPVAYQGHQLQVGASIGIAFCPLDATELNQLIKTADNAMYEAKHAGRGCWRTTHGKGSS